MSEEDERRISFCEGMISLFEGRVSRGGVAYPNPFFYAIRVYRVELVLLRK